MAGERTFGSYVLEQHLATGGMAEIFRARRVGVAGFARQVCIKRILPALSEEREFVEMFIDEARTGAQLRHGNIVGIDDFGEIDGQYYLCMEFVSGVDLAALLRCLSRDGYLLPFEVASYIAGDVLKALDYAHRKIGADGRPLAVVHRDVSPHNILVSFSGDVKLTDFGIAKAASRLHRTVGDVVKGKLTYMAPEQASGRRLDGRADLFALGVVFYEMVTGRRPFNGAKQSDLIYAVIKGERDAVRTHRPDTPTPIVRVIDRLLALDPEQRYAHGGDALLDLAEFHAGTSATRQLAAIVGYCAPDHPSATRDALVIGSLPRMDGADPAGTEPTTPALELLERATTIDPRPAGLDALPTAPIAPRIGDRTEIASPPTAVLTPAQIATDVIGAPPASAIPTRTIAISRADESDAHPPRETSPTDRTRTIAREAVVTPRNASTPSTGTRVLTATAIFLMLMSAAALAYVLFVR